MTIKILDGIKKFQEHLLEVGVARAVLALPAPRMLALSSPTTEDAGPASVFARVITEAEIKEVSRDLFVSGHYSLAVQESYKAVEKYIANKSGKNKSGTTLMEQVFSPNSPILSWSSMQSESEKNEQKGYFSLYSGAMMGIRNPVTHEFNWVDDPEISLDLIMFAQHLLRKAKKAKLTIQGKSIITRNHKG